MAKANGVLFLLALFLLWRVVPGDVRGALAVTAGLALPLGVLAQRQRPAWPAALFGAFVSAVALVGLSAASPELWCRAALTALVLAGSSWRFGQLGRREAALVLGLGVGAPLFLGATLALLSEGARLLLAGALHVGRLDALVLHDVCTWLAATLALLATLFDEREPRSVSWLVALALLCCGLLLASRTLWLLTWLGVRTDLAIWSARGLAAIAKEVRLNGIITRTRPIAARDLSLI